ncbi:MAG: GH3 auxin-responsive promoter family protein [Chlorobi bacterium]|nr:GH3 auxin-responsive promoter family protein [Chlorobiota bacterium]
MKSIKEIAASLWANRVARSYRRKQRTAVEDQRKWFRRIMNRGAKTAFGRDFGLGEVRNIEDFQKRVPLADYERYRPYIQRIIDGESDVLWPGRPLYFAKTSGTTSGTKYIPITRESMPYHVKAARDMLLLYIHKAKQTDFINGKMIFLQGSPVLKKVGGIPTGRLSGIVAHYVPAYLQKNRLPSWETNSIEDWETKVERVIDETLGQNMTVFSGIPSWIVNYFEKIVERTGKTVGEVFPGFRLFVSGGTAFEPYRPKFEQLVGRPVDLLETYPASEGFMAFSDDYRRRDLLLLTDHGMFYEFVPVERFFDENPPRLTLDQVETRKDYAIILTTHAGLYAYVIGDTVRFTSTDPYRIVVTGRIKHFISAFGEHVIAKEVEEAMQSAVERFGVRINEFSVAPQVQPAEGLPYHEWLVEFETAPEDMQAFAAHIDRKMQEQNIYYKDLIDGKILRPAVITPVRKGGFAAYMASEGKLGGQNKVPRLKNDRSLAEKLYRLDLIESPKPD